MNNEYKNKKKKKMEKRNKRNNQKIVKPKPNEEIDDNEDLDELLRQQMKHIIRNFDEKDFNESNKNSLEKKNRNNYKSKQVVNELNIEKQNESPIFAKKQKPSKANKLLIKTGIKWYEMRPSLDCNVLKAKISVERENELKEEAKQLLDSDIELYRKRQHLGSKRGDFEWIRAVLQKGTLADKLAAHSILLQDSAVHNIISLAAVLKMVNTKGKRECIMALDNLRELFIGDLLPNSKLKSFSNLLQYINIDDKNESRNQMLVLCYFEDQLKLYYRQFLELVTRVSHDTVEVTKHKALLTFFDLLVNNGEQEQFLLENLINKLGDPIPKLASQASHLLKQLVNQYHPLMKGIVVDEIERLLYRPNIAHRTQYYALCFLSETIFSSSDVQLANKLIGVYFAFFKSFVKKDDINNKMMSVLLTGVTRAFPYSKLQSNVLEEHLETFYKIIHYVNLNTGIQALLLIFNILDVNESGLLTDRFYCVLYRYILESQLEQCSRKAMFLNLIYRALKRDPILSRVRTFIKRLLQVALTLSSSLACSVLILISEIIKTKPGLMFAKSNTNVFINDDEDEEEKYEDIPLSDDDEEVDKDRQFSKKSLIKPSWDHNKNINTNWTKAKYYEPLCRNPLYANSESVDFWEFDVMRRHFHPSTSLFAQKIINKTFIDYDGDPFVDFTLKHFLDRFVFRNPKKIVKKNEASRARFVFGRISTKSTDNSLPISSQDYVSQTESKIPIDERFIYNYLKQRDLTKVDNSDIESVTSEEFERLLDRYEPGNKDGIDFAGDFFSKHKNKKSKKKETEENDIEDEELDDEFDEELDNDELNVQFDDDDHDFAAAFDGLDSELDDALAESYDHKSTSKKRKKGFDKSTNDLFASADEFAHLLQQNESDSDFEIDETDRRLSTAKSSKNKMIKSKEKKLGRRKKRKIHNTNDL